jgi:hypothetical protein
MTSEPFALSLSKGSVIKLRTRPKVIGALLLTALLALTQGAHAQAPCPPVATLKAPQLYGLWSVEFVNPPRGLPSKASMLLERHAEFSESLSGVVGRDLSAAPNGQVPGHSAKAFLAGDLEEGFLLLDESSNGINITGTWNAEMIEGSCGQRAKGVWKDTSSGAPDGDAPEVPFVMVRRGW